MRLWQGGNPLNLWTLEQTNLRSTHPFRKAFHELNRLGFSKFHGKKKTSQPTQKDPRRYVMSYDVIFILQRMSLWMIITLFIYLSSPFSYIQKKKVGKFTKVDHWILLRGESDDPRIPKVYQKTSHSHRSMEHFLTIFSEVSSPKWRLPWMDVTFFLKFQKSPQFWRHGLWMDGCKTLPVATKRHALGKRL